MGHPIVELAADPVPLGGLGTGRYLQGVKPVSLLFCPLLFCNVEGDPKHPREHALLVPVDPALGVDPPDVAGGPDDTELQLVRRASGDGGVQRAARARSSGWTLSRNSSSE